MHKKISELITINFYNRKNLENFPSSNYELVRLGNAVPQITVGNDTILY